MQTFKCILNFSESFCEQIFLDGNDHFNHLIKIAENIESGLI